MYSVILNLSFNEIELKTEILKNNNFWNIVHQYGLEIKGRYKLTTKTHTVYEYIQNKLRV